MTFTSERHLFSLLFHWLDEYDCRSLHDKNISTQYYISLVFVVSSSSLKSERMTAVTHDGYNHLSEAAAICEHLAALTWYLTSTCHLCAYSCISVYSWSAVAHFNNNVIMYFKWKHSSMLLHLLLWPSSGGTGGLCLIWKLRLLFTCPHWPDLHTASTQWYCLSIF